MYSKSKIDKAGRILSKRNWKSDDEYIEMDDVFNEYRVRHLEPLSEVTLRLQEWLSSFSSQYYIAQRLKRRPQILRKLSRLSVRLTQLQDIGGCRIIVDSNLIVDELIEHIEGKLKRSRYFKLIRKTDYREKGRDITGYRAVHLIVERKGCTLEIQIRSNVQHYWAESIERTSVIYGHHLKEMEGNPTVLEYFKATSDVFYEIECGRKPSDRKITKLDKLRDKAENIISKQDGNNILYKGFNENFIRGMIAKDSKMRGKIHNWMLVFDWNQGEFIQWSVIGRSQEEAIESYSSLENQFSADAGYEVVMIGASDASAIRHTHSHYFGIERYDRILENIDDSILAFNKRQYIGKDERKILKALLKKERWGEKRKVSITTLEHHFCRDVINFDKAFENLVSQGYVILYTRRTCTALNTKKKKQIVSFL